MCINFFIKMYSKPLAHLCAVLFPFFGVILGLVGVVGFWPATVFFPIEIWIKVFQPGRKQKYLDILRGLSFARTSFQQPLLLHCRSVSLIFISNFFFFFSGPHPSPNIIQQ